jgi:C-terminal processing protease CtpA/Prc
VQNIYDLGHGEAIFKLTERYYHLPGGRLIHRRDGAATWGVEPDVAVDMLPKQMEDALALRQDADVLAVDEAGNVVNNDTRPDPEKLLADGIDPQLEVALLLLRTQILGRMSGQALLMPEAPANHGS